MNKTWHFTLSQRTAQPRSSRGFSNPGTAIWRNGELVAAVADCSKAIAINPVEATAYAVRGLARLAQLRQAEDELDEWAPLREFMAAESDAEADFTKCLELDGSLKDWIERESEKIRKSI